MASSALETPTTLALVSRAPDSTNQLTPKEASAQHRDRPRAVPQRMRWSHIFAATQTSLLTRVDDPMHQYLTHAKDVNNNLISRASLRILRFFFSAKSIYTNNAWDIDSGDAYIFYKTPSTRPGWFHFVLGMLSSIVFPLHFSKEQGKGNALHV